MVHPAPVDRRSIKLNGQVLTRPAASNRVIDEYLGLKSGHWNIHVEHQCSLPVGAGYGTSGAGAASLSLALNSVFGDHFSRVGALRVAHVADVAARTGLGTVASVSKGGLAVRLKPGAPGIGMVRKLATSSDLRVVSGSFGPLSTSRVLASRILRKRVNVCSRGLLESLLRKPDGFNFLRLSRRFADCLGLASVRLRNLLGVLEKRGIVASMMMLGDGAFCIAPRQAAREAARLFRQNELSPVVSKVSREGAHLV